MALSFALFVVAGSLVLVVWLRGRDRQESREAFITLAETNANFIRRSNLPLSTALAGNLSEILEMTVLFRQRNALVEPAVTPVIFLRENIDQLTEGVLVSGNGVEMIAVGVGAGEVVFVRAASGFLADVFRVSTLLPLAAFWVLSLALALVVSRSVVRPIQALSAKLPDFESTENEPAEVPGLERPDEIGHLARTLIRTHGRLRDEQARREASERLALLGKMATGLAHEIRNPVAAVRLHAQLLEATGGESARLIVSEAEKIEGLVNQWMFLARPEPPSTRTQDLRVCLREVMAALEPAARHGGVRFVADLSEDLVCSVDASRMGQVFRNLLMNAVHAMPDGGDVRIEGLLKDGRVLVEVRDKGEGFTDEALKRFGELFFSTKEGGMGVGLSVATEIVRAHGGALEVSNAPDGGAVARVRLPENPDSNKQ